MPRWSSSNSNCRRTSPGRACVRWSLRPRLSSQISLLRRLVGACCPCRLHPRTLPVILQQLRRQLPTALSLHFHTLRSHSAWRHIVGPLRTFTNCCWPVAMAAQLVEAEEEGIQCHQHNLITRSSMIANGNVINSSAEAAQASTNPNPRHVPESNWISMVAPRRDQIGLMAAAVAHYEAAVNVCETKLNCLSRFHLEEYTHTYIHSHNHSLITVIIHVLSMYCLPVDLCRDCHIMYCLPSTHIHTNIHFLLVSYALITVFYAILFTVAYTYICIFSIYIHTYINHMVVLN